MTQAYNLSQLANKVNSSGQVDVATGITGTTAVANGGTGQTTYTNGELLIGNTTGNTLTKATLTAGTGISVTNSTGSITIASTVTSGQLQFNIYTSGTATWTAPAGVTKVKATVVGGGSGAIANGDNYAESVGGFAIGIYTVTPGTGYSVTVGAGGAASAAGGTSSFASFCSATGGTAGGLPGSGSSGNIKNGNIVGNLVNLRDATGIIGVAGDFQGASAKNIATGATAWSTTSLYCPGAVGINTDGGMGGVILLEYVG